MPAAEIQLKFAPRAAHGVAPQGVAEDLVAKGQEVGQAVSKFCQDVLAELNTTLQEQAPDELAIEFGVSAEGKKKLVIVEGSVTGHLKVTMKWKKKE